MRRSTRSSRKTDAWTASREKARRDRQREAALDKRLRAHEMHVERERIINTPLLLRGGPAGSVEQVSGPNLAFRVAPVTDRRQLRVTLPAEMDLDRARTATLRALDAIHEACLLGDCRSVFVEMKDLVRISPGAAVMLTAELQRCLRFLRRRGTKRRLVGTLPHAGSQALMVLAGLETFDFLKVYGERTKWSREHADSRKWFRIHRGASMHAPALDRLMQHYRTFLEVDGAWADQFQSSLVEVSMNVRDHAYKSPGTRPWAINWWWLAGFLDEACDQMTFVFWDQGAGVPATMRRRSWFASLLPSHPKDCDVIERATLLKETSTGDPKRRGRGLPVLKRLIDASPGGSMEIHSGLGTYRYSKGVAPAKGDDDVAVDGTLLLWTMQTSSIAQPYQEVLA